MKKKRIYHKGGSVIPFEISFRWSVTNDPSMIHGVAGAPLFPKEKQTLLIGLGVKHPRDLNLSSSREYT